MHAGASQPVRGGAGNADTLWAQEGSVSGSFRGSQPRISAEDVSAGGTDQVLAALELAQHALGAILAIPMFAGTDYVERITELGGARRVPGSSGHLVLRTEVDVRQHVGYIQHPVVVVVFQRNKYHPEGADDWDERPFVRTVEAWWAARAPGK